MVVATSTSDVPAAKSVACLLDRDVHTVAHGLVRIAVIAHQVDADGVGAVFRQLDARYAVSTGGAVENGNAVAARRQDVEVGRAIAVGAVTLSSTNIS
jgi:hypothetical protein